MLINKHIGVPFEEYFEQNKKLIYGFMNRKKHIMRYNFLERDDVFSVCSIGFINAYKTYVSNVNGKNVSFSTHLEYQMMKEFTDHLRSNQIGITYPSYIKEMASFINMEDIINLPIVDIIELCKKKFRSIKVSENMVKTALSSLQNRILDSLDLSLSDKNDEENLTFSNVIGFQDDHTWLYVKEFFDTLNERQATVLYCLMNGFKLVDISKVLKCTPENIKFIKGNIKKKYLLFFNIQQDMIISVPKKVSSTKRKLNSIQSDKEKGELSYAK